MSEPMTPEQEAKLRRYRSFSDAEMAEVWGEVDRLRASESEKSALIALVLDRLEVAGGTLDTKLQHQIVMDVQTDIRQGGENAASWWREQVSHAEDGQRTILAQAKRYRARVKELEEALREIHEVAARAQCEPPPDTGALVNICTIAERTSAPLLDRHASPNQDDVAEQSKGGSN